MFKVGDKVKCVDIENMKTLNLGMTYTITSIKKGDFSNSYFLTFKEFDNLSDTYSFVSRRFVLDIKETRKDKIKQICLNSK